MWYVWCRYISKLVQIFWIRMIYMRICISDQNVILNAMQHNIHVSVQHKPQLQNLSTVISLTLSFDGNLCDSLTHKMWQRHRQVVIIIIHRNERSIYSQVENDNIRVSNLGLGVLYCFLFLTIYCNQIIEPHTNTHTRIPINKHTQFNMLCSSVAR